MYVHSTQNRNEFPFYIFYYKRARDVESLNVGVQICFGIYSPVETSGKYKRLGSRVKVWSKEESFDYT